MKIIDAHHHLWDLDRLRYPWLLEPVDHVVGDYSAIQRSYRVADFLKDARNQELVKSVHVQAEIDHGLAPVEETDWLQSVADAPGSRGFPHGIVAYADLADHGVNEVLTRHCAHANMRGVRQMLNYGPEARHRFIDRDGVMGDRRWRAGLALLNEFGLTFDLQIWPWQMEDAARLARSPPGIASPGDTLGPRTAPWRKISASVSGRCGWPRENSTSAA